MKKVKDQLGNEVEVKNKPEKIISLVPSITELLFDIGCQENLVGVTKYCVHPKEQLKEKDNIGGTKRLKTDKIRSLNPDLIIGNKEENEKWQIEELQQEFPLWMTDVKTLEDAISMIKGIGELSNKQTEAENIIQNISKGMNELTPVKKNGNQKPKVAYFIWRRPWMVAGNDNFIDDLLNKCGLENVFSKTINQTYALPSNKKYGNSRYPEIDPSFLKEIELDHIFLSSEPFPFKERHIDELRSAGIDAQFIFVDGEMFTWYGSRLLHFSPYFNELQKNLN
ncbi:MAG: ABC transporter substrate-binding protein [Flavobacteriales bacterium]